MMSLAVPTVVAYVFWLFNDSKNMREIYLICQRVSLYGILVAGTGLTIFFAVSDYISSLLAYSSGSSLMIWSGISTGLYTVFGFIAVVCLRNCCNTRHCEC